MPKKKIKKKEEESLVPIGEQNRQLKDAETTRGLRKRSRYGSKDTGDAQKFPGKKFDEWQWISPDHETIKIPVRLVKEKGRCKDAKTEKTYFQVVLPEYTINESDTDIEKLRQKVFKAIEVPFEIEWTEYFLIRVEGEDHQLKMRYWQEWGLRKPSDAQSRHVRQDFEGSSGRLEIKIRVEEWALGTTRGGRKVSRVLADAWGSGEKVICKDWPEEQAEAEDFSGFTNTVLLPITPENRLALIRLIRSLSQFREQLDKLLHPDNAAKAFQLEAANLLKALPAPRRGKRG